MAEETQMMIPIDQYLKSGIHIGTKFKTNHMANFIYKSRPDGLFVLNLQKIDERLKLASNMISQYAPEDIIVCCRRENGWKPVKLFGKVTGVRVFPGRYPPGILTNAALDTFIEAKLMIVVDAWPDRNPIMDAIKIGIPVIAFADTNNTANNVDLVIPSNNKGKKSLGVAFWVLANEYVKARGLAPFKETIDDFTEE